MSNYVIINGELYHWGIKGMRWGVRRFQNKDGSLTELGKKRLAKDLKTDYDKNIGNGGPYNVGDAYKAKVASAVGGRITNEDKKRISDARNNFLSSSKKAVEAEEALDALAEKFGAEAYEEEMRRAGDEYDTPRSREKLMDYCVYDVGYDKARAARPDLDRDSHSADSDFDAYVEECRKVSDKILGKYGSTKLYETDTFSISIRETVGDIIMELERTGWKS